MQAERSTMYVCHQLLDEWETLSYELQQQLKGSEVSCKAIDNKDGWVVSEDSDRFCLLIYYYWFNMQQCAFLWCMCSLCVECWRKWCISPFHRYDPVTSLHVAMTAWYPTYRLFVESCGRLFSFLNPSLLLHHVFSSSFFIHFIFRQEKHKLSAPVQIEAAE